MIFLWSQGEDDLQQADFSLRVIMPVRVTYKPCSDNVLSESDIGLTATMVAHGHI